MKTQLPAIIQFVRSNGDMGVIAQMERASTVLDAANLWGRGVERFGINDVHPAGVALGTQVMGTPVTGTVGRAHVTAAAQAGTIHKLGHLAAGGRVPGYAPGSDTVPALLSPGEFVVNPTAARAFGYDNLHALNAQKFAAGGQVVTPGTALQKFESSVAQMTAAGRVAKLKSLVSLANTEHNDLLRFKAHSASWNNLEHLISLHKQEIAFLEKKGTHLPVPPSAPKPKAKAFPPGPVGAFERKIDKLTALISSFQAKAAKDARAFHAADFVNDTNQVTILTDARHREQAALNAYQASHQTKAQRAAAARARTAAVKTSAFNAAVTTLRTIRGLKTPQQKAAYYALPLMHRLADDLMHHSAHPYSLPGASSSAIHGLALSASPDLLNAIYASDWRTIAALLSGPMGRQFSLFKGLANSRGRKLALGGTIGERVLGVGMTTGDQYSFGESGKEIVTPANKLAGNPNARIEALLQENNRLLADNTRAVRAADQNNRSGLGHVGRPFR